MQPLWHSGLTRSARSGGGVLAKAVSRRYRRFVWLLSHSEHRRVSIARPKYVRYLSFHTLVDTAGKIPAHIVVTSTLTNPASVGCCDYLGRSRV
jgi:hypothetical protein